MSRKSSATQSRQTVPWVLMADITPATFAEARRNIGSEKTASE
jgi:hypothetical protein